MATTRKTSGYEPLSGADQLWLARKDNGRMVAVGLKDGSLCLYSPVKGLESLACPQGKVTHLLAPNHYHNKGLASFSAQYPRATICASKQASPRLKKIVGLAVKPLTSLSRKLSAGFELLEPEGLKTGEVWLRFPVGHGVGWLVADSFSATKMTATSTACGASSVPTLLGTFPSYAIADQESYVDWVQAMIKQDKPKMVIPCHGSVIQGSGLAGKLTKLVSTLS